MKSVIAALVIAGFAGAAAAQVAPPGTIVEHTSINRTSAAKDVEGNMVPPFTTATAGLAWQKKPFKAGGHVSILPIDPGLAPIKVMVTKVELLPEGNQCTGEKPLWAMTGAPIKKRGILDAKPLRAPSGIVAPIWSMMVYPANPKARIVPASRFAAQDIPASFAVGNIVVGVDLTGNGKPEAVMVKYCHDKQGKKTVPGSKQCTDDVQAVYLKTAPKTWSEHRLYEPC